MVSCVAEAAPTRRPPQPGYACKLERRGDFGLISTAFSIFDTGQLRSDYVQWDAGDGQFRNPWITAAFFRSAAGRYSLENGYVSIMRHIWRSRPGRRPGSQVLSLELTTDPVRRFASSRMAGARERSGGPFHLQLDWRDAAALARGSTQLYLVARDRHHAVADRVAIDRTIFDRAEPQLLAAFAAVEAMIADPRALCRHVNDLGTDDIVVT